MAPRPFVLLLCAAVPLACGTKAAPTSPSPPGRRVLLFGLDAGDWAAIDPLVAAGKLPALARTQSAGRKGLLLAEPPLVSPILWTTIATGRRPEEHGVLDFMVDLPMGGQAPIGVASRRVPALWNLFSRSGKSVGVVGWWATSPAEALRGTIVSDRVAPQLSRPGALDPESIAPAAARARLASLRVRPESLSQADLAAYVPLTNAEFDKARAALQAGRERLYQDRIAHLAAVVAATRTYGAMAEAIVREGQPDLTAVYFEPVDTLSHLFVRDPKRGPAALEAAYRDADALLGRLAAAVAPDTWIVVCSDHGFYPADAGIAEDPADLLGPATSWHRPYGIVAAAEARVVSGAAPETAAEAGPGLDVGTISPLDVAPTVLHAAGLPVTTRMPGHVVKGLLPSDAVSVPVATASVPDPPPASAPNGTDDTEAVARLRALGYVGAATTSLARVNLGEIYYRRGRLDAAERELRGVLDSQPDNLAALLWLAKALRGQGKNREALAIYKRASRRDPESGEAIVEAADLAASAGLVADATRLVAEASSTPRNAVSVAVAQAILARAGGHAPLAERKLRSALARDATAFEALSRLLDLTAGTPRLAGALPLFRRAAALAPASARHAALLGEALLASGDAAGAETQLSRALALAPDAAPARLDLARAQLRGGAAERALATLEGAPPSLERAVLRGASFSALERWPDAAREYRAALDGAPQASPELLNGLAWAELKSGREAEARALFGRSLAARRDQPEIRRLLAEIGASPRP